MHTINNSRVNRYSSNSLVFMIMIVLVLGCGRLGRSPSGVEKKIKNLSVPEFDPKQPFPSLSANVLDALSADVPELAKHREAVLAAERSAINGALADFRSKAKAAHENTGDAIPESASFRVPDLAHQPCTNEERATLVRAGNHDQAAASFVELFDLIPVAMADEPDMSSLGFTQQMIIGHQIGFMMADNGDFKTGKGTKTVSMKDEKTGEVQATMILSIEKDGGPLTMELTTKVSLPVFGLDANSKVSLTGELCPNSEGKVDITVKGSSNARAGSSGSAIYDKNLEARIIATVGDDANVVGADLDLRQATRSTAGGREIYVDTSQSARLKGREYSTAKFGEFKINRTSSKVTSEDQPVSDNGIAAAYFLAIGALESAKERWQSGGCIKIEAPSPGTVAPSSNTSIPVTVRHKFGGSEVPAKLDAALTGGKSVDPTSLARTSGTLTYTAPSETGKSATIKLTATSRRGKATLELTANTGGASYQIVGGLDDWQTNTNVCDIMKPFQLTGGGFTMELTGGLSGTYTYTGPFNAHGSGTYTISLPDGLGKPGTMTGGGAGSAEGFTNTGTEKYTLTPIAPCN